ncbi:MAG: L,D-transpeptidase [Patescibacteria group bacterium]|nr:L,D-transpeptidase [Patescibacteria group bacterium]
MKVGIKFLVVLAILVIQGILFLTPFYHTYAQGLAQKRIEVDLTNQRLYAFENGNQIYNFPISSGKPWWPTPTGTYRPWIKLRYDEMIGGNRALGTYYDLPNVPYVVYFYRGYAIHGTYWHNNFGHPMSHGCVNMRTADMAKLYYWIDYSTPIVIYGQTPTS